MKCKNCSDMICQYRTTDAEKECFYQKEKKQINQMLFGNNSLTFEQMKESTIELAEDHAMLAGMEKMKEQMMAKAVEVTVHIDAGGYPYIPKMELYDYDKDIPLAKEGDKYKVVLIKEE